MTKGKHIIKDYLAALKDAKDAGADDWQAAQIAERKTKNKHGRLPEEGKR